MVRNINLLMLTSSGENGRKLAEEAGTALPAQADVGLKCSLVCCVYKLSLTRGNKDATQKPKSVFNCPKQEFSESLTEGG